MTDEERGTDRDADRAVDEERGRRAGRDDEERTTDSQVEEASEDSFPASDPPSFTGTTD